MDQSRDDGRRRETLSSLMDGEEPPEVVERWLEDEAANPAMRADWHVYHMIGDALRSPGPDGIVSRDREFLENLRERLRHEPATLAPDMAQGGPIKAARPRRRIWAASVAATAGFLSVGLGYLATRVDPPDPAPGPAIALTAPPEDLRRASLAAGKSLDPTTPWAMGSSVGGFREILRLPRGPAHRPADSLQVLFSDGSSTISVLIEGSRPDGTTVAGASGGALNTLTVQRHGAWLTLTGDVSSETLGRIAAALRPQP